MLLDYGRTWKTKPAPRIIRGAGLVGCERNSSHLAATRSAVAVHILVLVAGVARADVVDDRHVGAVLHGHHVADHRDRLLLLVELAERVELSGRVVAGGDRLRLQV